ncbi:MAG: acetyl-CoA carboxylase biotin carboxyl carrier protein [Paracoccaceae bacterium]
MSTRKYQADVNFIEALAELLRKNDLTEVEVVREFGENETLNIRVARQPPASPVAPAVGAPALAAAPAPPQPPPAAAESAAPEAVDPSELPGVVPSPMVGTVYLQSEPGSPPFVAVGDTVTEGQTLVIIEAMKTMNQIPSPRAGRVTRIFVEDGTPVEFGAPLMIIE